MELLELPEYVLSPSRSDKVLWGIPFIGADKKAFRKLRCIQRQRNAEINNFWQRDDFDCNTKKVIDKILLDFFEWPNTFFHPQDQVNALFFLSLWRHERCGRDT